MGRLPLMTVPSLLWILSKQWKFSPTGCYGPIGNIKKKGGGAFNEAPKGFVHWESWVKTLRPWLLSLLLGQLLTFKWERILHTSRNSLSFHS